MAKKPSNRTRDFAIRFAVLACVLLVGYFYSKNKQLPGTQPSGGTVPTSAQPEPPKAQPAPVEVVAPKPAAKTQATKTAATVRIGTWNIEWLGKPDDRSGGAKGVAQSADDLADYVLSSGVDVLAVEEVVSNRPGRPIRSPEIEAMIAKLDTKSGAAWNYVLNPGIRDGDQLTGVVWNTSKVTALNERGEAWRQATDVPFKLGIGKVRSSQSGYLWNRPPHAIKFAVGAPSDKKTDFVLVPIHMKADYQGQFAAHRREEADALVAQLPDLRKALRDDDIVILGDSNCSSPTEPALQAFVAAGFTDLNSSGRTTHWRGEGSMDRALIPASQPEFSGCSQSFRVFSDDYQRLRGINAGEFKKRFSDHYLVYTDIAVMPDDD